MLNATWGVTVVVPTFRRPDGLARVLRSLGSQVDPGVPWSILVVDNDDPPGSQEMFHSVSAQLPVPSRLVFEPRRGASHARNRGITDAEERIIVFIDDDVDPEPGWLAALVEPIIGGRCEATGGRVVLDPTVPRPRWFHEQRIGGALAAFDLGDDEKDVLPGQYVLTASAAFTRSTIDEAGLFDPALGPRDGIQLVNDDVDFCRRVMATGAQIRYVPSAVVTHELPSARLKRRWLIRRLHQQGRSDWLLDRDAMATRPGAEATRVVIDLICRWVHWIRLGPRRWHAYQMLWDGAIASGFLREAAVAKRQAQRSR
jgi:glycosyltransferase involved in cell wall biosynthesis